LISLPVNILKRLNLNNKIKSIIVFFVIIINLFSICNVSFSQGRRDLDKFRGITYNVNDTLKNKFKDSTEIALDSIRRLPVDSTARIKYFKYTPQYSYGTPVKEKTFPLLLENSSFIRTEVSFDTLNNVIITEKFEGEDIKAPLVIPLTQYLQVLGRVNEKNIFSGLMAEKYKGITTDDLSKLFEKFTDITIPLPFKSETIFGPPTFNLRINGAIDITASYQNIKSDQSELTLNTSNQNNINFKQEVQVTAKGTVGDKLSIDADWNTQRTFDFENQLKIKYTGYADEVIQKIEAGNVSLESKSSLIQSTQALFGIKGEFKLGPLYLSAVVSQKKSKQETRDYVGGSQQQDFQINVWDYSDNHYFVDLLYKASFTEIYNSATGVISPEVKNNEILSSNPDFGVWVQCDLSESKKRYATAITMLKDENPSYLYKDSINLKRDSLGIQSSAFFRKLDNSEYLINPDAGFISLKINIPENFMVGVTYSTYNGKIFGKGDTRTNYNDTLILKMIKCPNPNPETTPLAWELKLKNIYRLPISKVIQDGFKLDVMYNNENVYVTSIPGESKTLSQMLNIDRYTGSTRTPPPDLLFDYIPGLTINTETGDIIFPSLKPFDTDIANSGLDTAHYKYSQIYTQVKSVASTNPKASYYVVKGSAKGEAGISNTINLGFNIVQNSVKILLGSTPLQENVDYSVDYNTGVVVIRNAAALSSKDLKISYETNDLLSLASKTLFGVRADYKISEKSSLGFTFVNLRQETLNDKVRIGEEPTNNSMFGLDFTTEVKSKALTKLVNLLPGYNTKEESSLTFKGEVAYMTPDPNTKKSSIPQDNNESVAYIDDMEGAKKIVSIGTNYSTWTISSVPNDRTLLPTDPKLDSNNYIDSIINFKRCIMRWYNVSNDVSIKDIYPLRDVQSGQDRITPFYIYYNPNRRGNYNYLDKPNFDTVHKETNWSGIMKYLNTTSTDLLNENINYIEFNMRIDNKSGTNLTNGKLLIDLGFISEDAIPNKILNTEDKYPYNGILDINEDIGLDGMEDQDELTIYNDINKTNYTDPHQLNQDGDPALDNNRTDGVIDYNKINGTQGNRNFEGGNKPDTEDLNRDGRLETDNNYFEYEVKLDTTNNNRISGKGATGSGWFQFRVPLSEFTKSIGTPRLTDIEYARIWIKGVTDSIQLCLVDFNLVGNQWYKVDKNDTTYNISVVSIEENPQIYQSPVQGDVLRQTVRNTSGVNTKSNEQSMALTVNNLKLGQVKLAYKDYRNQILDLFSYKSMKLFINGDPSFNYTSESVYDAAMVIRFGSDSANFYEYRAPIHPDVRPGQPWNSLNEVKIVFSDLTALKVSRDSANQIVDAKVPNGPPGAIYRVKGNPALNAIREFVLGIEKSRTSQNSTITGSVWFNELRVLQADDDNGYAFNINTGVKIADFANFSLNFSKVDPNFHALDARVGSRVTGQNWDISGTLNIHKFINNALASALGDEWKDFLNFPISFRHSENLINPKYYPGTDIEIDRASSQRYAQVLQRTNDVNLARVSADNLRIESQTLNVRNDISVNGMSFKFPGNNYFIKTIVNAFSINFSASYGNSRDITYERKSDFNYTGSLNYTTDFGLADKVNLKIGKILNLGDQYKDAKMYFSLPFLPLAPLFSSNFVATTDFNRTHSESKQRSYFIDDPVSRMFRANRGFSFNWKFIENWIVDLTGNYSVRIGSDLTTIETYNDSLRTQRPESAIYKDIFLNDGLVNFGKDLDYSQTTGFNPKFNLPVINKFVDITGSYNVTYGWQNPNTTTNIGYNVGYSNTINVGTNIKFSEIFNIFKSTDKIPSKMIGGAGKQGTNKSSSLFSYYDDKPDIGDFLKLLGTFFPENMNLSFNQTNQVSNPGVQGRPGFGNFWLLPSTKEEFGPSRLYQLGLSMYPGKRAPNLVLTDLFNQSNNLTLTATISPILPQSIKMNLTFKDNWGFNNSASYTSDMNGELSNPTNKTSSRTKGYSMFFAGSVDKFSFEGSADNNENTRNISSAFKKSIGSIPFPNWSLTISGVEKFPLFSEFATTVTIENSFTSEYNEATSLDLNNLEVPSRQSVTQSFNPLIGLNITFKQAFGGSLTASLRFNNSVTNTLVPQSNLIQTTSTNDWSLTANYAKAGFEIPFFGLSLKNDIAFALTVSKNTSNPLDYRFTLGSSEVNKIAGNGSSVTTINPSIQYSISSKVQMQLFFKYIRTEPTQDTYSTVPRTSSEGGLNIRISIQ
jgi:cell surface protein SprA